MEPADCIYIFIHLWEATQDLKKKGCKFEKEQGKGQTWEGEEGEVGGKD